MIITVIVALLTIIAVILTIIRLHEKQTNAICQSKKKLEGRVAVVTGGTAGMGLEIATDFARRGAKVIIACPFKEEGANARQTIIESTGNQRVIFKLLDLKSFKSVREFATEILNTEDRLDILMNNAGVAFSANTKTYNGTNFMMAVNYLGHFLLTLLLLPLLKKTGSSSEPSRIINVSSVLHLFGSANYESYKRTAILYRFFHYCNSKYCFMLFTHELSIRLKYCNVVVNAVDPGAVGTNIYQSLSKFLGVMVTFLFKKMFKTPWEGAQTALYVALDDEAGNISGQYFKNCKLSRAKTSAYDDKLSRKLWNDSVRLVKLEEHELKLCGL